MDIEFKVKLLKVQKEIDRIVQAAHGLEKHDAVYDLETSHSSESPRVRRSKTPHLHFPFIEEAQYTVLRLFIVRG